MLVLCVRQVGGESSEKGNAAQQALARVQSSVEKGGFWQQYSAVLALRMTPVVPFRFGSYNLSPSFFLRSKFPRSSEGLGRAFQFGICAQQCVCLPITCAYLSKGLHVSELRQGFLQRSRLKHRKC